MRQNGLRMCLHRRKDGRLIVGALCGVGLNLTNARLTFPNLDTFFCQHIKKEKK
jgi:hypothetical protein